MRFLRLLLIALTLAAATLVAPSATAATVTVGKASWGDDRPSDSLADTEIGLADCLADASIRFDVTIAGADTANLFEIWAGAGCAEKESRTGTPTCVQVATPTLQNNLELSVRVQDIVQAVGDDAGPDKGTEETCRSATSSTGALERSLFFMVIDQSTLDVVPSHGVWKFSYDLTAPSAPTGVTASPDENALGVDFKTVENEKVSRVRFYCSAVGSEMPDESAGGAGSTTSPDGSCASSVLIPGQEPPADKACGSINVLGASSGTTHDKLINDTLYAVAVAGEDEYGNVGVLSNIACATPVDVTGYFEAYRAAGGQGGGGFCSFGRARQAALPVALGLLIAAAALVRRRR